MTQPTARPRKPEPQLADYPHQVSDLIRYADLDPQRHVNNAVFSTYFESGRVAMFRTRARGTGVPTSPFVLARSGIDSLRESRRHGNVMVGTDIVEPGRSSGT